MTFDHDMDFYVRTTIKKTAFKFISDPSHILNGCYETKRFYYEMPRAATLDFWKVLFHLVSAL